MSITTTPPPRNPDDVKIKVDDDGEWEDVPDARFGRQTSEVPDTSTPVPSSPRFATPRRRKVAKTTFIAAQPQPVTPRRLAQVQKARRKPLIEVDREQVQDALVHGAAASVRYFGSVITDALRYLRKPLGVLVFLWLLAFIMVKLSDAFRTVFEPAFADAPRRADYPRLVEIQDKNFDDLLSRTASGSALSLDIKNAEMATKDLVTLVKVSELKSRDLLASSLIEFVDKAKKAGKSLQRVNAKINGAVDRIMVANDHALHTIEGAREESNSLLRVIWPFAASETPQDKVVETFRNSMELHASEMHKLILEVELALANLDALDDHLSVLHELCARENLTLSAAHERLLSELWTILGGNRARLRKFSTNLELLQNLGEYRKRAQAHVAAAMQTLQGMGEDMEDLRERVAAPEIVGDLIPIEVHMKSIQSGMERLKEQRIKAREREQQLMNRILGIDE